MKWAESGLAALLFCLLFSLASQWWTVYEFDTDEGLELGKALLVANGFHPYLDIWNDQPPLFSFLLAVPEYLGFGHVTVSRLLVLFLGCLLLHSLFRIVRHQADRLSAWLSCLLLVLCSGFGQLSVSVMAGLPAIALLVVAFDLVLTDQRRSWLPLGFATALVALSLLVKLFTVVALPAFVIAVFLAQEKQDLRRKVLITTSSLIGLAAVFLLVAWASRWPIVSQGLTPHFTPDLRASHNWLKSAREVWIHMDQDWPVIVLGLIGMAPLTRSPWRKEAVPAVWLAGALAAFLTHAQIWWHHMLLLSVPLAWLSGLGYWAVRELWPAFNGLAGRISFLAVVSMAAIVSSLRIPNGINGPKEWQAAAELSQHIEPNTTWVLVDRPMDAYRNKLLVPPELVVFSSKRRSAGNLTASDILASLEKRKPDQVLLRRFKPDEEVRAYLDRTYAKVESPAGFTHYTRIKTDTAN